MKVLNLLLIFIINVGMNVLPLLNENALATNVTDRLDSVLQVKENNHGPFSDDEDLFVRTEDRDFQSWTNQLLAGLEPAPPIECEIFSDLNGFTKIGSEKLCLFYDPKYRAQIQKLRNDIRSLKDEEYDFFAWKTLDDHLKYAPPPVTVAMWIRVNNNKTEKVLRIHVFRSGNCLFQSFWNNYVYTGGNKQIFRLDKIPASLFTIFPFVDDDVFTYEKALSFPFLRPNGFFEKQINVQENPVFHTPGFHEGYLISRFNFCNQQEGILRIGYADKQLFDICVDFPNLHANTNCVLKSISAHKDQTVDLQFLNPKDKMTTSLLHFSEFPQGIGCNLIYMIRYNNHKQGVRAECFYSTPDRSIQFSIYERVDYYRQTNYEYSYYVDVSKCKSLKIPSRGRKPGDVIDSTDTISYRDSGQRAYIRKNKRDISLLCLKEDRLNELLLAQRAQESGEFIFFYKGKVNSIKKNWPGCLFSSNYELGPVSLDLSVPVIGRMGGVVLRSDCF